MAKATIKTTCKKCGEKVIKSATKYNRADANNWEVWAEGQDWLCDKCKKAEIQEQRAAKNEAAAIKADIMGLPKLEGSDKQIAWAETIRQEFIETFKGRKLKEEGAIILEKFYNKHTDATYWINNRMQLKHGIYSDFVAKEFKACADGATPENKTAAENADEKVARNLIAPENKQHALPVLVKVNTDSVSLKLAEKNETLITIARDHGYKWAGGEWLKRITFKTGIADERAAEIVNELLNAGFMVECDRHDLVEIEFEPECTSWVTLYKTDDPIKNRFSIEWKGRNNTLYSRAKSLPGARWNSDNKSVHVPLDAWQEVEDFAALAGFKLSPGATKAINDKRMEFENAKIVNPKKTKKGNEKAQDPLKSVLESSREVLDDLKDEPL